jgi:hypothetical protein
MDIRLVAIPCDDLLGIDMAFVVPFFNQVLKLGYLIKALLVEVSLLGIEIWKYLSRNIFFVSRVTSSVWMEDFQKTTTVAFSPLRTLPPLARICWKVP